MAGLQRSSETFRRSGSSGLVWEDINLPGQMNTNPSKPKEQGADSGGLPMIKRNRSSGGGAAAGKGDAGVKAFRTDQVAPAMDPPSPKMSCCGFCGDFSKPPAGQNGKVRRR